METIKRDSVFADDFIGWVILESTVRKPGSIEQICKDEGDLKIQFSVNGVELPFVGTLREIEAQIDRMVAEKAEELLRNRLGDSLQIMRDTVDAATRKFKRELGVTDED